MTAVIDFFKNSSSLNVAIACITVVAVVVILTKKFGNIKAGKNGLELVNKDSVEKDNRTVMVEIMNFTWKINNELSDGERFYKKLVRREVKERLYRYSTLVKTEYLGVLRDKYPGDYKLTYSCFTSTLDGQCYMKMLQLFMDLYEHNHISNMNETERKAKAHDVYLQCTSIFKEQFMEPWLEEMCNYEDLQNVCLRLVPKVEDMCLETLTVIQNTLKQLYSLRVALQNVRNATSAWIIEKGLLPPEAEGLAENFFEPNKGLNVDNVNNYLNLIKL